MRFFYLLTIVSVCTCSCGVGSFHQERLAQKQMASVQQQFAQERLPALTADSHLEEFMRFALLSHPAVKTAYHEWVASVHDITIAKALPDPAITMEVDIQKTIVGLLPGIASAFVSPSTLRAQVRVAAAQSNCKYFAFERSLLDTALEVKKCYFQLDLLRNKEYEKRRKLDLLSKAIVAVESHDKGEVSADELRAVRDDCDTLIYDLVSLNEAYAFATCKFKASLGLLPDSDTPLPSYFEYTPASITSKQIVDSSLQRHPRLAEAREAILQAEHEIALAKRGAIPSLRGQFQVEAKQRPTTYIPQMWVTLPGHQEKIRASVLHAQAQKEQAEAFMKAEEIQLLVDFSEKVFYLRDVERRRDFLRICQLPRAEQKLEQIQLDANVTERAFLTLAEAECAILDAQIALDETAVQREEFLAELLLMTMGEMPSGAPVR